MTCCKFQKMNTTIKILYATILFYAPLGLIAQQTSEDTILENHVRASFPMLRELLSIPNDAFFEEHIMPNVNWCERALFPAVDLLPKGFPQQQYPYYWQSGNTLKPKKLFWSICKLTGSL